MERRSAGGTTIFRATVTNVISVNTYFYIDDATGHGFLIDPGAEAGCLLELIDTRGWTIEKILLTHGHYDHITGVPELLETCGTEPEIYMSACDLGLDPVFAEDVSEVMLFLFQLDDAVLIFMRWRHVFDDRPHKLLDMLLRLIEAFAAFDAFGFINLKLRFLFRSHGITSHTLTIIFPLTLPSSCAITASRILSKSRTFPLTGTSFFSFRKEKISSMTC